MTEVKRYYVGINTKCLGGIGLVEMTDLYRETTGFDGLVMGKDYDMLKAENDSLCKDAERFRRMRAITLEQINDTEDEFDAEFDRQVQAATGQGEQS